MYKALCLSPRKHYTITKTGSGFRKPCTCYLKKNICWLKIVCHFTREAHPKRGIWLLEDKSWILAFATHKCGSLHLLFLSSPLILGSLRTKMKVQSPMPKVLNKLLALSRTCLLERNVPSLSRVACYRNAHVQETCHCFVFLKNLLHINT